MMNDIVTLLNRAAEGWCLFVLHAGWQAGVVALVALAAATVGRRWPAPLRHCALLLALLKFAMPPLLAVPTGLFTWSGPVVHERPPALVVWNDLGTAPNPNRWAAKPPDVEAPPPAARATSSLPAQSSLVARPAGAASGGTPGFAARAAAPVVGVRLTWRAWLMLAYAVVALGMGLRIAWELVRLGRLLRAARRIEGGPLHDQLIATAKRLGVRRRVRLLVTEIAVSPMAVGVLRPAVVLPAGIVDRASAAELGMILAHEMAHHRRGDLIVNWFQLLLRVAWWFHPLFWLLDRQVRRTREDCCDDLLLARGMAERQGYCEALLAAAKQITQPVPVGATLGMAERLHPLGRRLARIMDGRLRRSAGLSLAGAAALLVAALVILPGLRTQAQDSGTLTTEGTKETARTAGTPETKSPGAAHAPVALLVVESGTGRPFPGAAVHVSSRPTGKDIQRADYVTDAAGRLTLQPPTAPFDWLRIGVKSAGCAELVYECEAEAGQALATDLRFEMQPFVAIGGVVQDEQGKPVRGVKVGVGGWAKASPGSPIEVEIPRGITVVSGADGRWRYDQAPRGLVGNGSDMHIWLQFHHDDFVSDPDRGNSLYPVPTDAGPALLKLVYITTLKKGTALSGRVLGPDGKPISGARVGHWFIRHWISDATYGKTDDQGRFLISHLDETTVGLLVLAKGCAPQARIFEGSRPEQPVEFRMQPGVVVHGQVVDPAGKPIAGVKIKPTRWPRLGNAPLDWQGVTDQAGRFEWDGAPADEVTLDIEKDGYEDAKSVTIHPSEGKPLALVLAPVRWLSGRVVDDQSGRPITDFRVAHSFRIVNGIVRRLPVEWQTEWRDVLSPRPFTDSDGKFRIKVDSGWQKADEMALRVMAKGYLPAISRPLPFDQPDPVLEFRLKRGNAEPAGRVVLPDGSPANGAAVMLGVPQFNGALVMEGRPDENTMWATFAAPVTTGADGRFEFWPEDRPWVAVALDARGYDVGPVTTGRFQFWPEDRPRAAMDGRQEGGATVTPLLRLKPWARVEGQYLRNGAPVAQERMMLTVSNRLYFNGPEPRVGFTSEATTDAQGRFVWEHVPATAGLIARIGVDAPTGRQTRSLLTPIAAGRTVQVEIGPGCIDVVGSVELPEQIAARDLHASWGWVELVERAAKPALDMPSRAKLMGCNCRLASDGSFRVDAVPPGEYEYQVWLNDQPTGGLKRSWVGSGVVRVAPGAPGGGSGGATNLGAVKLRRVVTPAVGMGTPAFEVAGADGQPLRLADLRGRYVLLCFWDTQTLGMEPRLEQLRDIAAPFMADEHLAVVGINMNAATQFWGQIDPGPESRPAWREGVLRFGEVERVAAFGVGESGKPTVLLIDPEGKVVATGLEGKALTEALEGALNGKR